MFNRNSKQGKSGRRDFLRLAASLGAGLALPAALPSTRFARAGEAKEPKLLFVVAAAGGASIVDSFLPVTDSQSGSAASGIVSYPDEAVGTTSGSPIRHVKNLGITGLFRTDYDLGTFVSRHKQDLVVVTQETTSVNHVVAQKRAITGAGIDSGRTLMERVAEAYGEGLGIPNCNLASGSYVDPGDDDTVKSFARAEVVSNPLFFPLSTHGSRGILNAPGTADIARVRAVRKELEAASPFVQRYGDAALMRRYEEKRTAALGLEKLDLLTKLMLLPQGEYRLSDYDVDQSPMLARMLEVFPNLASGDVLESQAAVGFLLAYFGVSCSVTIGPSFVPSFLEDGTIVDTPLMFDFSHNDHVTTQNVMWGRMMQMVDGLVTLLKEEDYLGEAARGKMWDRSLVYVATDFGRSKERPKNSQSFGSGHDLSNGNVLLSPMLKGNRVYGGVEVQTAKTYGFDRDSGEPDADTVMREGDVYSLVCHAMGVDFPGRKDMPGLVKDA